MISDGIQSTQKAGILGGSGSNQRANLPGQQSPARIAAGKDDKKNAPIIDHPTSQCKPDFPQFPVSPSPEPDSGSQCPGGGHPRATASASRVNRVISAQLAAATSAFSTIHEPPIAATIGSFK